MSADYGSASTADATSGNLIRSGTIVDRRLNKLGAQVRVVFPDRGVTSDWLPVSQQGSAGALFYYCPRVGDNCLVAHMPTSIEMGTVIATNPTPNNPSFTPRSINAVALQTDDHAYFEHDPDAGCFSMNGVATIYVNAQGQIVIIAGGDINVTTQQNLNIIVTGNVIATISGNLTANVSGTATIQAPNINLTGDVNVSGALTVGGNATVNGSTTTVNNLNIQGVETGGGSV